MQYFYYTAVVFLSDNKKIKYKRSFAYGTERKI